MKIRLIKRLLEELTQEDLTSSSKTNSHQDSKKNSNEQNKSLNIRWIGDALGSNDKGETFYEAFCKNDDIYRIGDFVLLKTATNDRKLWICKITQLFQKNDSMQFYGQWMYTFQELKEINKSIQYPERREPHPKELFVSYECDFNDLVTVAKKCQVKYIPSDELHKYETWLQQDDHFFFSKGYDAQEAKIFNPSTKFLGCLGLIQYQHDDNVNEEDALEFQERLKEFTDKLEYHKHHAPITQPLNRINLK